MLRAPGYVMAGFVSSAGLWKARPGWLWIRLTYISLGPSAAASSLFPSSGHLDRTSWDWVCTLVGYDELRGRPFLSADHGGAFAASASPLLEEGAGLLEDGRGDDQAHFPALRTMWSSRWLKRSPVRCASQRSPTWPGQVWYS